MPQSTLLNTNLLTRQLQLPNGSLLRNRLAKASMSEALGTYDNRPTLGLVTLYQRWAASGIGLILTGNVMIDRRALGEPGNVVIEDEADLPILQKWARAATDQGAAGLVLITEGPTGAPSWPLSRLVKGWSVSARPTAACG